MKKFKKAKIITALCSALTIIGTTSFLVSCSDVVELPSDPQEKKALVKNEVQNIINEVIQEDNSSYQDVEEKNKVNKEVAEIAKKIFDLDSDFPYTVPIDGDKTDIKKFEELIKSETQKITENQNFKKVISEESASVKNLTNELEKTIETAQEKATKENINRSDTKYWQTWIINFLIENSEFLKILKTSSLKTYVEQFEQIFQKKEVQDSFLNFFKNGILTRLEANYNWEKEETGGKTTDTWGKKFAEKVRITDEKVREKVKVIVTKTFENEIFKKAVVEKLSKEWTVFTFSVILKINQKK